MKNKKSGRQTVRFEQPPSVLSYANAVGKKEGEGPLGPRFDYIAPEDSFGQPSWEKSEQTMQKMALAGALDKGGLAVSDLA